MARQYSAAIGYSRPQVSSPARDGTRRERKGKQEEEERGVEERKISRDRRKGGEVPLGKSQRR